MWGNGLLKSLLRIQYSPLAKWTVALRGDAAKACPNSPSARAMSVVAGMAVSLHGETIENSLPGEYFS
jgi:hypothetical protein